jgi:hypothetical protein
MKSRSSWEGRIAVLVGVGVSVGLLGDGGDQRARQDQAPGVVPEPLPCRFTAGGLPRLGQAAEACSAARPACAGWLGSVAAAATGPDGGSGTSERLLGAAFGGRRSHIECVATSCSG